jgi:hypothetical protein
MRSLWGIVLVTVLGTVMPISPVAYGGDPEPDSYRKIQIYSGRSVASASCRGDLCDARIPPAVMVSFPDGMGAINITATLTIEYLTTRGDPPLLDMTIREPGAEERLMSPGFLMLRAGQRTTTTLTWAARNVSPSVGEHRFSWAFEASHLAPPFEVKATEAVLVIEATPV